MELEIKAENKDSSLRPEIRVLRAACDSLIILDGLTPEELDALAVIRRDLSKLLLDQKYDAPSATTFTNFTPTD
jgi:hypothetical protein